MANILVVQDVSQNMDDIKSSIESGGHRVFAAKSVESAKTLLEAASFDMVICAVHVNNGTAFDLLRFVKSDPDRRTIPFFLFSYNPTDLAKSVNESVQTTARLLGADKYIANDVFDAKQFLTEIASLLPGTHQRA